MEPSRTKQAAFVAAAAMYYAVYALIFGAQVAEYFRDVVRHFGFVRRLF